MDTSSQTLDFLISQSMKIIPGLLGLFILVHLVNLFVKSEKVDKFFSVKSFFFFVLLSLIGNFFAYNSSLRSNSQKWEQEIYNNLSRAADSLGLDKDQKKEWIECGLGKAKRDFPNGRINISQDSLQRIFFRYGKECFKSLHNQNLGWSKYFQKVIKDRFMDAPELQNVNITDREVFVDCLIEQLKIKYPAGLDHKLSELELKEIAISCNEFIK